MGHASSKPGFKIVKEHGGVELIAELLRDVPVASEADWADGPKVLESLSHLAQGGHHSFVTALYVATVQIMDGIKTTQRRIRLGKEMIDPVRRTFGKQWNAREKKDAWAALDHLAEFSTPVSTFISVRFDT